MLMLPVRIPGQTERSVPAQRLVQLADQLADELDRFDAGSLRPAEIKRLLDGMSGTAAALTRILDELRTSPVLAQADNDLALPSQQSLPAELAQAAAAAEDLMVTAACLSRLLPTEPPTMDRLPGLGR